MKNLIKRAIFALSCLSLVLVACSASAQSGGPKVGDCVRSDGTQDCSTIFGGPRPQPGGNCSNTCQLLNQGDPDLTCIGWTVDEFYSVQEQNIWDDDVTKYREALEGEGGNKISHIPLIWCYTKHRCETFCGIHIPTQQMRCIKYQAGIYYMSNPVLGEDCTGIVVY